MSLILKGIDLPIDSDIYILAICEKGDIYIKDGLNQYVPLRGARAVQIPKDHGRIIDADALELEKEVELADDWKTAHEIANCVKYAPTILEAEE